MRVPAMIQVMCTGVPTWANPLQGKNQHAKRDQDRDFRCTKCGQTGHQRAK